MEKKKKNSTVRARGHKRANTNYDRVGNHCNVGVAEQRW